MTWYRTGTITLTSGSATVTGEGTLWVTRAKPGEALYATDGKLYEVLNVTSDTELQLTQPYIGAAGAGVPYVLVPTRSIERVLAGQVAELVNLYSTLPETATNAQAAAQAAAASAIAADERADAAVVSASSADADRIAAEAAADAAGVSATLAGDHAAAAEGSASSAGDSATLAGTRATAAGVSATAADDARVLAQAAAASASNKEPLITAGLASQYWRGDKSWQALNKAAVGLDLVDNTADTAKPVSTAQAAALALKAALAGPTFTGAPKAPNNALGVRGTAIATMESFLTEFTHSKLSNGWQKLPSGLIVQWLYAVNQNNVGSGWTLSTFPIAFPNATLSVSACPGTGAGKAYAAGQVNVEGVSLTAISWVAYNGTGGVHASINQQGVYFLAVGH